MPEIPRVRADPPAGWKPIAIAPPKIAESAGAVMTQWSATGDGTAALVLGCVATPIPGWVEDMRPAVEGRTVALAGKAASLVTDQPMDARAVDPAGSFDLRAASDLTGPVLGHARTFIGFDATRVFTCFATCVSKGDGRGWGQGEDPSSCSVAGARLENSHPPPPPGVALRSVTWAVHHPRPAAFAGGAFVFVVAVLAIVFRPRPRFSG